MNTVILAEKPSVAIQIADFLNTGEAVRQDGYIQIEYKGAKCAVTWAYGHLLNLKNALDYDANFALWQNIPLPFFPKEYEITVKNTKKDGKRVCDEGAKKQLYVIKKLFDSADEIINATDYDREGELIFAYIYEYCNCTKPYKKAKINSNVKSDVQNAFLHLEDSSSIQGMANAGKARNIADWIVGSNLTVFSTLNFGDKQIVSIGRVQTPTLNIIVNRENEINSFKSEDIYNVDAIFSTTQGEQLKTKLDVESFKDKAFALNLLKSLKDKNGKIEEVKAETVKKSIPMLYNTSVLQIDANNKYGYTLDQTADICQFLYENGYITYPRTSSRYLTQDSQEDVQEVILRLMSLEEFGKFKTPYNYGIAEQNRKFFADAKVEAHGAIIPTSKLSDTCRLSEQQRNIYCLVANSLIHMVFESAVVNALTVMVDVDGNKFKATGKTVIEKGWYEVTPPKEQETLPDVSEGEMLVGEYTMTEGRQSLLSGTPMQPCLKH